MGLCSSSVIHTLEIYGYAIRFSLMSHQKKRNLVGYWLDLLWYCDILENEKGWRSAGQGSRKAAFLKKRRKKDEDQS